MCGEVTFSCFCAHEGDNDDKGKTNDEGAPGPGSGCIPAYYDKEEWNKMTKTRKIPVIDPDIVTYEEFFARYIVKNMPCMLSRKVTSRWLARQKWVKGEGDEEEIDFEYLLKVYGGANVTAVNCDDSEYKEGYGARDCRVMLFRDYVKYWKDRISSRKESPESDESPCLYLKDWHIVRFHQQTPEITSMLPYETPIYFQSDFLNESCTQNNSDDFKFCYMGPAGSFTSFHADVYGSYSWSANVFGVKRWLLYPPGKELKFYTSATRVIKYVWETPGKEGEDYIEVIQKAGECIFVPSGWHHVVWNITDAISINHNWFNGANLTYIWSVLQKELKDVENELADLRGIDEYQEQCQLVLKANHGMNYEEFFQLLKLIKENRENEEAQGQETLSAFQLKYDLDSVAHLMQTHIIVSDADANDIVLKGTE